MQFQQSQLTRSTQFSLRQDGLFVSQRDSRGAVDIALEVPYEEVLPVRLEYQRSVPQITGRWVVFSLFGLLNILRAVRPTELTPEAWGWAFGLLMGLGLLVAYAHRNWWHKAIVHTANLQVTLADHPRDRRQLRAFVQDVENHTKRYLRQEYAPVNPLGLIEPQLRRLAWLHKLDVLSTPEAQALATRLTGRLPGRGFKSMGRRLEAPYVN
ncbi:hypothetical protein E4631_18315 [Hymenobacter sp. UV11]|uniref:hypothetical protein n=1 Tax=Hymenobacter sp. UV11 TaxID=1849735 RepID=UPI00106029A6|nr:hypothetical protein [Hymenobacter sp. UV11]TFZ64937.1 hypothetical protein E4631_18315 [Hymenobacter sp. UV11]